jgi:hypothetical protein
MVMFTDEELALLEAEAEGAAVATTVHEIVVRALARRARK